MTVFVTGAGSGIGRATARLLGAQSDTSVVCIDRDKDAAQETAGALPSALAIQADISDEAQCLAAVRAGVEQFGNPRGLVHCAAVFDWQSIDSIRGADLDRSLAINVNGSFYMARAVANTVMEHGHPGSIVLLSSGGSRVAMGAAIYSATKAAVEAMVRDLAVAWATHPVRVNAVLPGVVKTPMSHVAQSDEGVSKVLLNHTPMGRFGEAEEIAEACAFLISDKASYITGACLPVDGGFLAV